VLGITVSESTTPPQYDEGLNESKTRVRRVGGVDEALASAVRGKE